MGVAVREPHQGSHAALIAAGGHYARLENTSFQHRSPDYRPGYGFVPVQVGTAWE